MSEAKVITTNAAVRAKSKPDSTRVVYKNVVGSPFLLKWPTILPDLSQTILTQLIKTLEPIGQYKKAIRENKKKNKDQPQTQEEKPELYHRLHIGLNETTRFLEGYIEKKRTNKTLNPGEPVIYICKREIKPIHLCQHILTMAALANVKIAQMPADAENRIGKALGINRASVVIIELLENKEEALRLSARDVPVIDAPWLNACLTKQPIFANVQSKTLKTTAPIANKKEAVKRKLEVDDTNAESSNSSNSNKKACIKK